GRSRDPAQTGRRVLAVPVEDAREAQLVLQRVRDVDVGQRTLGLRDDTGDPGATPGTDARRPLRVDTDADLGLPLGAGGRWEVGEVVRRPGVVRAVDRRDLRARQVALRVDGLDLAVVPARDLAEVDLRQQRAVQVHDAVQTRQVVRDRGRRE